MPAPLAVRVLLSDPLPGREQAREAARRELQRQAYDEARPPLVRRVVDWVMERFSQLLDGAAGVPGGRYGVLLLALLVTGVAALVVGRLRPAGRSPHQDALFPAGEDLSAEDHRQLAERAVARGEMAEAVRERLRAVVRALEDRGVLDPRPGRTAEEVVAEAGARLASLQEPLRRAVVVFEQIWYGGRPATWSAYSSVVEVDELVTRTRLART